MPSLGQLQLRRFLLPWYFAPLFSILTFPRQNKSALSACHVFLLLFFTPDFTGKSSEALKRVPLTSNALLAHWRVSITFLIKSQNHPNVPVRCQSKTSATCSTDFFYTTDRSTTAIMWNIICREGETGITNSSLYVFVCVCASLELIMRLLWETDSFSCVISCGDLWWKYYSDPPFANSFMIKLDNSEKTPLEPLCSTNWDVTSFFHNNDSLWRQ